MADHPKGDRLFQLDHQSAGKAVARREYLGASVEHESIELMKTLVHTVGIIANASAVEKRRISEAHTEARALAASIPPAHGSARPRIEACLERFQIFQAAGDVAAAGWMLTALQERLAEKNLAGWEALKIVADKGAELLQAASSQVH